MAKKSKIDLPAYDKFEEFRKSINSRWKIYIDTCSLYRAMDNGSTFWDRFVPVLKENDCKFIVTVGTFEEIKGHKHGNKKELAQTAAALERVLLRFKKDREDLMVTIGAQGEFHDEAIQARIRERARSFNQVYITNDLANAWDVYNSIRNSQSVDRNLKKLLIYKINKNGDLVRHDQLRYLSELTPKQISEFFTLWHGQKFEEASAFLEANTDYHSYEAKQRKVRAKATKTLNESEASDTATEDEIEFVEPVIQSLVNPDYEMPKSGDRLRAVRGEKVVEIVLGKRIARGGEGIVYEVEEGDGGGRDYLAKIYKKNKLTKPPENAITTNLKINYIVGCGLYKRPLKKGSGILGDRVMFPLYVLVNDDDEFVGYLMGKAAGIPLLKLIADGAVESEFRRLYPEMTKIDLIDICLSFLDAIEELHKRDIIVGDLNANNILVDPTNNTVHLIDADSYQYAGGKFPCNVGVEKYTSPEFLENHESKIRTEQNELFVVARILCEVLMMVDNPYNSKVSEGDPVRDMLDGRFRYTFEFIGEGGARIDNSEAPSKDLQIRWGQLPRPIKNAFGNTFHKDGKYWNPGNRRTASVWINYLKSYRAEIEESIATGNGVASNDVFPTVRRKWVTRVKCKVCGKSGNQEPNQFKSIVHPRLDQNELLEIAQNYHFECYCAEHSLVDVKCSKCGADMGVGQLHRDDGKQYICRDCLKKKQCRVCGKSVPSWTLDDGGRCKKCHSYRKVKCSECGKLIAYKEFDSNGGICNHCRDTAPCNECGRRVLKSQLLQNGGICDYCRDTKPCKDCGKRIPNSEYDDYKGYCSTCRRKKETYCGNCGAYMGRRFPRSDGKKEYCEECWKPAKCKVCGWDNYGKLVLWMLDEQGRCRRCAAKGAAVSPSARSAGTSATARASNASAAKKKEALASRKSGAIRNAKPAAVKPTTAKSAEPPKKKSFFERLFGL